MLLAVNTFWGAFLLLLIWVPLVLLWFATIFDLFRRDDLSGWKKVAWVLGIILIPWFGALVYLIVRPLGRDARRAPGRRLGRRERRCSPCRPSGTCSSSC